MKSTGSRILLFRLLMIIIVVFVIEIIGYIGMWYNSRSFDWLSNKNYFRMRAMLMGDSDGAMLPRYLTLPYLGYVPYPGYTKYGTMQHNDAGYRGTKIPLLKTGRYRVLCLGGSTTYGLGVGLPSETYPAQLELLLNKYFSSDSILSKKYGGVEVLNAGLEAGTSAEELQQYLFKYRYYRPDVVVVHSGINDAEVMENVSADFQLDYTHYRRLQFHLESLPAPARWLMRSYFFSFITIRLFYTNFYYAGPSGRDCYVRQRGQTFCRWTDINMDSVFIKGQNRFIPYYRNTQSLYDEIIKDSSTLLILPNILNVKDPFVKSNPKYLDLCIKNAEISRTLGQKAGADCIPFSFDSIRNPAWWKDDCHLNAAGEKNLAEIVLPHIVKAALNASTKPN